MQFKKTRSYAFGSSADRFGKLTFHPKLNSNPGFSDPSYYHPKAIYDIYPLKSKTLKEPWRNKMEIETWSANLGYRNKEILIQRKYTNSLLGPAFYEIKENVDKLQTPCKNVGFGRTPRYKTPKPTLGQQSYFKFDPYKAPYGPHSERPTFEREDPCRFPNTSPKWLLAPNRYRIIDKADVCEKSNKTVSLRGPYDLFSGNRNQIVKNHFATIKTSAATWPYGTKSTFEILKKKQCGVLNKTNRTLPYRGRLALTNLALCIKNPKDPGPTTYDVYKKKDFKQYMYGFNSSSWKPPGYIRTIIWPSIGRYDIKNLNSIPGNGHKNIFCSKTQRTCGAILPQPLYSF